MSRLFGFVFLCSALLMPALVAAEGSGEPAPIDVGDGSGEPALLADVEVRVQLEERAVSGRTVRVSVTSGEVVLEQFGDSGATLRFEQVPQGLVIVRAEAAGFETVEESQTLDRERAFSVRLLPAAAVAVSGRIVTSSGVAATAATITLTGAGARGGATQTTQAGVDGVFRFVAVLPGFYSLRAELAGDALVLDEIELLAATELSLALRPSSPRPGIAETRSACSASPASGAVVWLALAAFVRRRRRC